MVALITVGRPEDVDLAVPPLAQGQPSGVTLREIASGYSKSVTPDWARACNVEYRAGSSGPPVSLITEGGKVWSTGDPRWPVMLMTETGPVIKEAPTAAELASARWAFGAGPWLLRGGQSCDIAVEITRGGFSGLMEGSLRERAAIGIREDGCLVHYASMHATLSQVASEMMSRGCRDAINLDGGGSVGVLDAAGKILLGYSVRQVCCALVFRRLAEETAGPGRPAVNCDLDFSRHLTANFTLSEFRCKCGCGAVSISPEFVELVARLQMLRSKISKPVYITSGYRCAKHDAKVGTSLAPGSGPHTTGTAADIYVQGMSVDALANAARACGFTGIGRYHGRGFVHIDLRQPPAEWVG